MTTHFSLKSKWRRKQEHTRTTVSDGKVKRESFFFLFFGEKKSLMRMMP